MQSSATRTLPRPVLLLRHDGVLRSSRSSRCCPQRCSPRDRFPSGISWPSDPQWHNFVDAWKVADITPLLVSSMILVAGSSRSWR